MLDQLTVWGNVLVETEALEIDREGKRVRARGPSGESWIPYDSLILAQGGTPVMPSAAPIQPVPITMR